MHLDDCYLLVYTMKEWWSMSTHVTVALTLYRTTIVNRLQLVNT